MSPAPIRLDYLKPGESSSPSPTRAETMHVQSRLYPRSTNKGSSDGIQQDTIIFIVVGVVCLIVILIGFYFVSRPHAASDASRDASGLHPEHASITPSSGPQRKRNIREIWKIWKPRHHTSRTKPTPAVEVPTLQISSTPITPSPITPARAMTYPLISSRPSQARRVTSLSVTTSFSHSHITQEELNNFRISAYDLDGDLETEMLNSAREDLWSGHALAVEAAMGSLDKASYSVDGGAQGPPDLRPTGDDYESSAACQTTSPVRDGAQGDGVEVVKFG